MQQKTDWAPKLHPYQQAIFDSKAKLTLFSGRRGPSYELKQQHWLDILVEATKGTVLVVSHREKARKVAVRIRHYGFDAAAKGNEITGKIPVYGAYKLTVKTIATPK